MLRYGLFFHHRHRFFFFFSFLFFWSRISRKQWKKKNTSYKSRNLHLVVIVFSTCFTLYFFLYKFFLHQKEKAISIYNVPLEREFPSTLIGIKWIYVIVCVYISLLNSRFEPISIGTKVARIFGWYTKKKRQQFISIEKKMNRISIIFLCNIRFVNNLLKSRITLRFNVEDDPLLNMIIARIFMNITCFLDVLLFFI